MQIFYLTNVEGNYLNLPEEESKHCVRVLRMSNGDKVFVVDGIGNFYTCTIANANPKRCELKVEKIEKYYGQRPFHLHIAIAPTKNSERLEWFIEKATEIGIDEITPMLCEHSERKAVNIERLQRVMVSAMKQSVKAYLPKINPLTRISELTLNAQEQTKLMAYCGDYNEKHANEFITKGESVIVLIGPEGDFTPAEVQMAIGHGFKTVGLGTSRLRTETAGLVACTICNLAN
jgi:16S rRNA (uracil1498-N3)-methyltransferase